MWVKWSGVVFSRLQVSWPKAERRLFYVFAALGIVNPHQKPIYPSKKLPKNNPFFLYSVTIDI